MSWHRFPAVFRPFSTVFRRPPRDGKGGLATRLPFSGARSPLRNGENGCRLPEDWRPRHEDEAFARQHGMNPKDVAHALRHHGRAVSAVEGRTTDESAVFRDWVLRHAIEAPPAPTI
jgi:hypothetical protein